MYSYNYSMPRGNQSMYKRRMVYPNRHQDERFFGGFAVPFLLGGIAGYALNDVTGPRPMPYPVYPNYTYNYYPYPYPYSTYNYYY